MTASSLTEMYFYGAGFDVFGPAPFLDAVSADFRNKAEHPGPCLYRCGNDLRNLMGREKCGSALVR